MNLPIIFFIAVVQGVLFIAHYVVFKSVVFFGDITGRALTVTRLSFLALSIFFVIGSIVTSYGFTLAGRALYTLSATWLGILLWLFFTAIAGLISWFAITYIFPTLGAQGALVHIGSISILFKHLFGGILLAFVLAINVYGIINAFNIKTTEYTVALTNLPEAWIGKKVVFIADTHFGNIWNTKTAVRVANKVQSFNPDAVLIAGDFYDGPIINFNEVTEPFNSIKTKYGIFYATGNHEEYRDKKFYIEPLEKNKVNVLQNEFRNVDGLVIAGINYGDSNTLEKQQETLNKILALESDSDPLSTSTSPIILIKHVPNLLESTELAGVDLQVSGHTHRGQMWPLSIITKIMYKGYDYGLKDHGSLQVLTTSGAGSWGPPQRIGTNSEVVVITLEKK